MAQHQRQRWILVGGLGLTASLWLLQSLSAGLSHLREGVSLPLSVLVLGGWWWWQKRRSSQSAASSPVLEPYDRAQLVREWTIVESLLAQLEAELPESDGGLDPYTAQRQDLLAAEHRSTLTLGITGQPHTGKSGLVKVLRERSLWSGTLEEIPWTEADRLRDMDVVVVLINGDLTQSELDGLAALGQHPGLVVALNKQDQYLEDALGIVVAQVKDHLKHYFPQRSIPLVTIAAQPQAIKRRTLEETGTWQEDWHQPQPEITALVPHLQALQTQAQALICATTGRQLQGFKHTLHQHLNSLRRGEALKLIQNAQGIAALAAGVNPVATLDLLATLAVNGQLVADLARLYHQPLSLKDGEELSKIMAALLVKLGLVELSSQLIAPVLKAHHLTYVAGAIVQGLSAAYLTRVAGLAMVDYLESLEPGTTWNPTHWRDRLPTVLRASFARLQAQDCWTWLGQTAKQWITAQNLSLKTGETAVLPSS